MSKQTRTIEYIGEILPDGHISLPDEVMEKLDLISYHKVKVTIVLVDIPQASDEKKGWDIFRLLGRDAAGGKLTNASVNHDKYIYGKEK